MEIVGKSQVALGNRGKWCYPFENQDTMGTETLVIDLKFDITQWIMPNWLSNWNFSACQTTATMWLCCANTAVNVKLLSKDNAN
jgi:hypothetical protein